MGNNISHWDALTLKFAGETIKRNGVDSHAWQSLIATIVIIANSY